MSLFAPKFPAMSEVVWPDQSLIRNIALALGGVLLLAASAKFSFPLAPKSLFPVSVTLQTLVVLVLGTSYGWRLGGATLLLYFSLGALDLPVFAQGGGIQHLWTTPSAGYLYGFLFAAILMGWLAQHGLDRSGTRLFPAMLAGHAMIYLWGVVWLASFVGMDAAFTIGFKPFVVADILKCAVGAQLVPMAWRALNS